MRDLEFVLFEMLDLDDVLASGAFGDLDRDSVLQMLSEAASLAEGPLAESFADADTHPPVFDAATNSVRLPASFKKSVLAWQGAQWPLLGIDEAIGGAGTPATVSWAITEFLLGAQPAAFFYLVGPAMLDVLHQVGNAQQQHWARVGVEREWGATMVLTEPDAGSDVGAIRTRAVAQADGTWHIEGTKRFITSGDSDDLFENIAHLVLARPVGAGPGTKGLSLFLVPKYLPDPETGEPGERNGVHATALEHKLGLTASATCEMMFGGQGRPAVGYLVGDVHDGIAQMFRIMEFARMAVGIKAIATLSTGYLHALDYARSRIQGTDLARAADRTAPRVPIIEHPDVRRSLLTQKAYAEGLRALYLYAAAHQDPESAMVVSGADPALARRVSDLLLPLVKGAGSERAFECLVQSLQVLGGSGYLTDYPVAQYLRDAKIDSLYEGTTAIQANDLLFRKIVRDDGVALAHLLTQVRRDCGDAGHPELAEHRQLLEAGVEDLERMTTALRGYVAAGAADVHRAGLRAVPYLLALADLLVGWLLLRQARLALDALADSPGDADRDFYRGKVTVATFFAATVLPRLSAERTVTEHQGLEAMAPF